MRIHALIITLIEAIFAIAEFFLGLRLLLKFFGANTRAPFVRWVYGTSEPLLEPFRGMFPAPVLEGRFVLEFSTLFALVVYALIAYFLIELIGHVYRASRDAIRD